ncbi:MAG: hypothetical protein RLZZ324_645 [Candidatus Parcubacteria bacterium]|jgi:peptidoglycan/xylan/chitin deacetylase (PgdA/CDA1 family)
MTRQRIIMTCAIAVAITAAAFLGVRYGVPSRVMQSPSSSREAGAPPAPQPAAKSVRVPILVYHNVRPAPPRKLSAQDKQYEVTPAELEAQLSYLRDEHYTAVTMEQIAAAMRGGTQLPEKPVAITFDDGRESQFVNAAPLVKKYGFIATYYVFTNAIGRPNYLTWEQLKTLQSDGNRIESHTRFHPFLTKDSDADLEAEIVGSKKTLEDGLGMPVTSLAYPFGLYDDRVIAKVRAAGYDTARTLRQVNLQDSGSELLLGGHICTGSLNAFKALLQKP